MFEKIEAKLHEIHGKPAHIRQMYVWAAVAAVMLVMVTIWIMSFAQNMRETMDGSDGVVETIQRELQEKQSIGEMNGEGAAGSGGSSAVPKSR